MTEAGVGVPDTMAVAPVWTAHHLDSARDLGFQQGLGRQIGALRHGDHLCMFYEDKAEQMRAVVPFIQEGLGRQDRCVYVADEQTVDDVVVALEAAGVEVSSEKERGALVLLTKRDCYLRSGRFDAKEMIAFLQESVDEALADGFAGYRVTGEMTWSLGTGVDPHELIRYEALLNRFFPGSAAMGLCQYSRKRFPVAIVREVLRTHPLAVLGGQVCQNLYYEPPEFVLEATREGERVDWMVAQLQRWHRVSVSRDALQREVEKRRVVQTQLEETAAALERSNKELEHFAYVASHDLQEPLRTIAGYAQLLKRRHGDVLGEQGLRYVERTVAGTERMGRLINDLLDYSRVHRGGRFEPVDLEAALDEVLRDLSRMIKDRDARIQVGDLPRVLGDASQLRRVLSNLVTNSLKYCPPGRTPRVSIEGSDEGDHWHVQVTDNASGIPKRMADRVFVLFQRLVPRTEGDTGTGIGLAIAKRIVERHGGAIWLDSTEGEGSVFHFTIAKGTGEETDDT